MARIRKCLLVQCVFFALSIHSRAVQVALRAPHDVQGRDGLVKEKRLFVECADQERYHTRSTYVC